MTIKNVAYFILSLLIFSALPGCGSDPYAGGPKAPLDPGNTGEKVEASEDLKEIIGSFSNSIEMAALIKSNGVPFSMRYLSDPDQVDNYTTEFEMALALGVLGADLGYLNMYGETSAAMNYLDGIRKLSANLNLSQFFDFETLRRLAVNNENLDSLMYISLSSFNRMDRFLRDNNRDHISALMVSGLFTEGLYLATQVVKEKPNEDIKARIGEQIISLKEMRKVLYAYSAKSKFADLTKDFDYLIQAYDGVEITYIEGDIEMVTMPDGSTKFIQHDESIVSITDQQLARIIKAVEKVRSNIVQLPA